ncbi:MAG: GNAT family N-acetyltransferase [Saprospiraceae bacterium]|nr:GNAT family N-acetyltransferase [Saprospiraceae bacterium]
MFLRPYRAADKRFLQHLFFDTVHSVNARDYTPEQLDAWAPQEPNREAWARIDAQHCFIVEFQKGIVGFASLSQEGLVDFLFVHKDFQGRGIASTLLKQLERIARKKGLPALTAVSSTTARGFFEKRGFILQKENRKALSGVEFLNFKMEKVLPLTAPNNT